MMAPDVTLAIATTGLSKRFGAVLAVDAVDLAVPTGARYGFLGPNGSGKTTTLRMLLGLVFASAGSIEVLGQPMPRQSRSVLAQVGALVEGPAAYGHLCGRANLELMDAPDRVQTDSFEGRVDARPSCPSGRRPVKAYSLGMRQRLGLAAALLRAPRLLIPDEPTNGLDPQGIHEVRELLLELNYGGTTIFLSSHLLAEVEALCTTVGVVDRGRLVVQDELAALRRLTGNVVVGTPDAERALALLDGRLAHREADRIWVQADDPARLNAELVAAGVRVADLRAERR